MKFSEIALHVEVGSPFPITSMARLPEGVTVVITAQTPDGKEANATLYLGEEQMAHGELIAKLATDASEALQRYVESFEAVEPPKWDEMKWGP